jgi:hypothetical protein
MLRWRLGQKLLFIAAAFWLTTLPAVSGKAWVHALEQWKEYAGLTGARQEMPASLSGAYRLAEMVDRKDSVVYRTDSNTQQYEQRQWEEQQKENKSWNMLNNLVIDGRQPPRRPPGPRPNDMNGRQQPRGFSDSWAKDHP